MDFLAGIVAHPWGFEGHTLNLDRGPSGDDYGNPMNLDWNSGHIWTDCRHINWELFWDRDCLSRGLGRVGSWYDRCCAWDCALQELGDGFHRACCSVPIS